jgi:hypothetical protein
MDAGGSSQPQAAEILTLPRRWSRSDARAVIAWLPAVPPLSVDHRPVIAVQTPSLRSQPSAQNAAYPGGFASICQALGT